MKTLLPIFVILALSLPFASAIKVFTNPVIPEENLPDPGAIFYEGYYYVANTGGWGTGKFAIHRSVDLQNWDYVGDVFTADNLPTWSGPNSDFWAPELHIINGQFRVIFTSREVSSGLLCVGIGSANTIAGPYTDSGAPVIKNTTVGSIDASVMSLGNGTYYLIWKDDGNGNNPQIPTWIKAQQLNSDGLSVSGTVYYLLDNTLAWEADVTEGPWVIQRGNYYYLFYSGHGYCDASYAVGVARSQNPLGPYEKKGDPILKSDATWLGPGHCSVLPVNGQNDTWVMIYHSWYQGQVCGSYNRLLMIDYVYWSDDEWPYMTNSGPTSANPYGYTYWKWFD